MVEGGEGRRIQWRRVNFVYFGRQNASEKLGKQADAQLSEASNKIAELQKELNDLASHKNRVQQENFELVRRLEEVGNQLDQANKGKLVLSKQLEETKQAVDDEATVRNKVRTVWYSELDEKIITFVTWQLNYF